MLLMERQRLEMKMTTMLVDRDINNGECIEDTNSEWDDDWSQGGVW